MPISSYIRDEIGRLRAEAKHFRELARGKRIQLRMISNRSYTAMDRYRCRERISEYTLAAQERERIAKELRAAHSGPHL